MKLRRLYLLAFGPFTERVLEFDPGGQNLVLVHGPNEAGKSSALRAISDLRFGIPQLSRDNFLHPHPDMRVGGVFIDKLGREHALMRRKGRGATLHHADLDAPQPKPGDVVSPDIEALLTCGLRKEEHDTMFGLDHQQLRDGGKALLKGEGEIGAALFEASAGVRSIPQLLEKLDQAARQFFMPGTRARNARINEALRLYEEHHAEYRQALVRPSQWADLFRKHQATQAEVADLEARLTELDARRSLINELRAVAPMLRTLDHTSQTLRSLDTVRLLPDTASTARATAQAGLASAQHNRRAAIAEAELQRKRLAALTPDPAILQVARAIKRLAAAGETINRHRVELAQAAASVTTETQRVADLAAAIDPKLAAAEVLKRAPGPAARIDIERLLREAERAHHALEQHRESMARRKVDAPRHQAPALPSDISRTALRVARAEIARNETQLQRLATLPSEIRAAQRAADDALNTLGLSDASALHQIRPLLDAQIDAAMNRRRRTALQREERERDLAQATAALQEASLQHDRLLAHGPVPTPDDVAQARLRRDAGWTLVRSTYIEQKPADLHAFTGGRPLAVAYEDAVAHADRLADDLARDSERAANLQATRQAMVNLQGNVDELTRKIDEISRDELAHDVEWQQMLANAQLPALDPSALRDWQALLPAARAACETVQARLDELERLQELEQSLAQKLRRALHDTGMATPADDLALATLAAMADEVEDTIRHRENAMRLAEGKRMEREEQDLLAAARETELVAGAQAALAALAPIFDALHLPDTASITAARARLDEFHELSNANDRLASATATRLHAQHALSVYENDCKAIADELQEPQPDDMRLYIENVSVRLEAAEQIDAERMLAQQALDTALENLRAYDAAVAIHTSELDALCRAAGVDSVDALPEAEEQSRRKREAQVEVDKCERQLAQASRRAPDALRALLQDQSPAQLDADEARCAQETEQLRASLKAAREREDAARRELDAVDSTDTAAMTREAMERAAASVRVNMEPWIRSRLAHRLLAQALAQFRERAQAPMLQSASNYFQRMTAGEFERLVSDDTQNPPILLAQRQNGAQLRVESLSEGTLDQLYLALRLAALDLRREAGVDLPVILDDVLMTSDDHRAQLMLQALADFSQHGQVIVFTHHSHLAEIATHAIDENTLNVVRL